MSVEFESTSARGYSYEMMKYHNYIYTLGFINVSQIKFLKVDLVQQSENRGGYRLASLHASTRELRLVHRKIPSCRANLNKLCL